MSNRRQNTPNRPVSAAIPAWTALSGALKFSYHGKHLRDSRENAPAHSFLPISHVRQPGGPVSRILALCALLCAFAGCRFDANPAEFDVAAGVGETVTEILEVTNTGDELVELTLTVSGAPVTFSTSAETLQAGEVLDIEISSECFAGGERESEIAVTGRTGNKAVTVRIPFVLRCHSESGTYLVALELFQGPPIYKKDYRTGTEIGPINLHRPENGAPPVPEYQRAEFVDDTYTDSFYPSKDDAWSFDNEGFVTAIWGRRAAVALTAYHMDESPSPEFSASVDNSELPILLQETERVGDGFETVAVFDLASERYQRAAVLSIAVESDGFRQTDSLSLFGETVEPLLVTWIPVDVPDFPAPTIDAESYMEGTTSWLPVAEYKTGIGPTMQYVENGNERPGSRYDIVAAVHQLWDHHALHACGRDEIYVGYPDNHTMFNEEGSSGSRGVSFRNVAIGTMVIHYEDEEIVPKDTHQAMMINAHEIGHLFGQQHVPGCHMRGPTTVDYPYEDNKIGPARGWDWISMQFVYRDEHLVLSPRHLSFPVHDFMAACGGEWIVSDFAYQLMMLHQQSSEAFSAKACEATAAAYGVGETSGVPLVAKKSAPAKAGPQSIAITGVISPDGATSISMAQPTNNPPWATQTDGEYTLQLLDAGGSVLHQQPIRASTISHGHGEALWSARVPFFEHSTTVVLRGPAGSVQIEAAIEAGFSDFQEIRNRP